MNPAGPHCVRKTVVAGTSAIVSREEMGGVKRIYDPEVEASAKTIPMLDMSDVDSARATVADFVESLAEAGIERPTDPRVKETERTIPASDGSHDIPIRIYTPIAPATGRPAFVNFHGGGFALGNLETEHGRCLAFSSGCDAVAVAVDYRLAPEHPFPAGAEDCYAALEWVAANAGELGVDPARIVVGGGSAGGCLSTSVALMARDRSGPAIACQMLFYPVIDDSCSTASMTQGSDCYIWNHKNCLDMWDKYLGGSRDEVSAYAAPVRATDLAGLPAAFITTCEHDPLRDEAIHYALRLMEAGVPVELKNYAGTVHAFDILTPSAVATRAINDQLEAFTRATATG